MIQERNSTRKDKGISINWKEKIKVLSTNIITLGRQKRGKTNYEMDDIEEDNVVVNNPNSNVVTIARTLGDAKFSYNKQGNKKVK